VRGVWLFALGLIGGGLAVAAAGLAMSGRLDSAAFAEALAGQAAGQGIVVSATPLGDSEVVICLVDTSRQRLAVYLADAKRSRLKLLAVRDIAADWSLTDYNNDPPLPKDVRARAEKAVEAARPLVGTEGPKPETSP
jgi:hypothetical protein